MIKGARNKFKELLELPYNKNCVYCKDIRDKIKEIINIKGGEKRWIM